MINAVDQEPDCSTLDELWDFFDIGASEQRFRQFLEQPLAEELRAEALTQLGRTMSWRKRIPEAHGFIDQAAEIAPARSRAEVRVHLERGRAFNSGGDPATAIVEFLKAWDLGREIGQEALAVDAAHMVAVAETEEADQIEWNERALELAAVSAEPKAQKWRGTLLNNLGWTYHDRGELEKALHLFQEARDLREENGDVPRERIARWCVARCLRSMGRVDEALNMQRQLLVDLDGGGVGFVEEELGECLTSMGRPEGARPYSVTAYEKLSTNGEIDGQPERLARLKEMAGGDARQ